MFGIFTSIAFIGVFYKWSQERASVRRLCVVNLVAIVLVVIYSVVALTTTITNQSRQDINSTIGRISIVTSVGMFGAPLATTKRVVQTKSAASLPFTMCLINAINCLLWIVLCLTTPDKFVMIPNAAGGVLAIMQVVLWLIYRPKRSHTAIDVISGEIEIQVYASSSDDSQRCKSFQVSSPMQEVRSGIDRASDFAALRSPECQTALMTAAK